MMTAQLFELRVRRHPSSLLCSLTFAHTHHLQNRISLYEFCVYKEVLEMSISSWRRTPLFGEVLEKGDRIPIWRTKSS